MNNEMYECDKKLRDILEKMVEDEALKKAIREKEEIDLFKDLEFDSLHIMIFLTNVEEKFNIDLIGEDNVMEIINSYRGLLDWLSEKQKIKNI
ncbi:phosphopantetheine-binding protein [Bovifimicola ammoniilytica]|jgi:acyl carrier protein|uniref:phosphopantetheine-binding protein n=1 Tax=Bovifimicola ammoniilytica TaxID=2981720 RepID=UPI000820BD62|nr:phosphopantetheine-binding protein [Bovifimicola ammoniilytica]MCU6754222.1 phosphopantetheine-binding protein [Bovifimicola ammoniilytica]MDD6293173.1 phosphopantetheine-binding protein [Eubacteriales bacterium]SCJ82596.1 acyl carrier protein [uncultured Eubacterium sp.]